MKEFSKRTACLVRAKAFVQNKENWCQGQGTKGHQRCAMQAVWDEEDAAEVGGAVVMLNDVAFEMYGMHIVMVNDKLGHEETMKMFDTAINRSIERDHRGK